MPFVMSRQCIPISTQERFESPAGSSGCRPSRLGSRRRTDLSANTASAEGRGASVAVRLNPARMRRGPTPPAGLQASPVAGVPTAPPWRQSGCNAVATVHPCDSLAMRTPACNGDNLTESLLAVAHWRQLWRQLAKTVAHWRQLWRIGASCGGIGAMRKLCQASAWQDLRLCM